MHVLLLRGVFEHVVKVGPLGVGQVWGMGDGGAHAGDELAIRKYPLQRVEHRILDADRVQRGQVLQFPNTAGINQEANEERQYAAGPPPFETVHHFEGPLQQREWSAELA